MDGYRAAAPAPRAALLIKVLLVAITSKIKIVNVSLKIRIRTDYTNAIHSERL
jgi:hypothetical protein